MNNDQNETDEGRFSENGHGLGTVTPGMVRQRAREIAIVNGRSADNVLQLDLDQAHRELTGHEPPGPQPNREEQLTEDSRWDPVPVSEGNAAPTVPMSDEQTFAEKLIEEGIEDAEHDQMVKATKASLKREGPE